MRIPKNSQIRRIASPVRYFYFTPPDFSNEQVLFLIPLDFQLYVQKSRTEVRDFCLHLFCQCTLE